MEKKRVEDIEAMSKRMRKTMLTLAYNVGNNGCHISSALSCIEILAVLYGGILNIDITNPNWENRDRFILSKGHGALAYYTSLEEVGMITKKELYTFDINGGDFPGQPSMNTEKGIDFSSGSLGHGISIGLGVAMAAKKLNKSYKAYVVMGDGECNEGTVWESAICAAHYKVNNLVVIIDRNKLQSDGACEEIMNMGDIAAKWNSFGWNVITINGHDVKEIYKVLSDINEQEKPTVIIANTVKGKGVSFIENKKEWHHNRLTKEQLERAMRELEVETC